MPSSAPIELNSTSANTLQILQSIFISNIPPDPDNPKCKRCGRKKHKSEFDIVSAKHIENDKNTKENSPDDSEPKSEKNCRRCVEKHKVSSNVARKRKSDASRSQLGSSYSWPQILGLINRGFALLRLQAYF